MIVIDGEVEFVSGRASEPEEDEEGSDDEEELGDGDDPCPPVAQPDEPKVVVGSKTEKDELKEKKGKGKSKKWKVAIFLSVRASRKQDKVM